MADHIRQQQLRSSRGRAAPVVDVFAWFDVVEELLVADGVCEVRQRLRYPQRLGRTGAGRGGRPGRDPGVGHGPAPVGGQEVDRAQPVEHGVAPVGVGEVEQDEETSEDAEDG